MALFGFIDERSEIAPCLHGHDRASEETKGLIPRGLPRKAASANFVGGGGGCRAGFSKPSPAVVIPFIVSLCLSLLSCGGKNSGPAVAAAIPPSTISSGDYDAEALPDKPVLHILIAAADTCQDSRLKRTYAAGRDADTGAAERAAALADFLLRQKTGSLYSNIVIRALINEEFSKAAFLNVCDELKTEMKADDTCILYFSAYSNIDRKGDLYIIPWDGKKSSRRRNIAFADIAKNAAAFPSRKTMIFADTNRGDLESKIPQALERLAVNLEGLPLIVTQNNSTAILINEFENSADERYVAVSHIFPATVRDFFLLDRWLDPGVLRVSSLFPGTVTVTGSGGSQENFYLDSLESAALELPEDAYTVTMVYRNSHQESRAVDVYNNSSASIAFAYRPGLSVRDFSGPLPSFGVNIAELNPSGYRRIDQNVLSAMGMEQYRISFLAGEKFYQNGDYDKAIAEYNNSIRLKSNFAEAYIARGNAYRKRGNLSRAIEDYSLAIQHGGGRAEVYNYRGFAYAERGETDKAVADFSQAIRLRRDYGDAYINRAHAYYEAGDYDRAIDDYTQVIRLEPRNASAWNRRGSAWYRKGDGDRAIADFSQAIAIQPNYALAWHNRGNVWFNRGDYEKALTDLNQVIRLNPSPGAYLSRGSILQRLGETARAEADFAAAR